ncbi:hypothetical protein chiPu_0006555 [Chiloscyllium punctatum]|uniref:Uncharacterized protein n=1 Tax=Chiloscyllium punctatum TaxID=137246 RepID=A0A401SCK4_CHIPU|nr:hypothetical protein [Chiloscyllium punctatum]
MTRLVEDCQSPYNCPVGQLNQCGSSEGKSQTWSGAAALPFCFYSIQHEIQIPPFWQGEGMPENRGNSAWTALFANDITAKK